MTRHRILVIEDELPIRRFLRASLESEGYEVQEAQSGNEGLRVAASHPPDMVILDLGLPDTDGQTVLMQLREWFGAPIIVLSARDQEAQKVEALDQGADDYITKPFGVGELLARMRNALRHAHPIAFERNEIVVDDVRIDLSARLVAKNGQLLHLTPIEYKLLVTMFKQQGKMLTHRYLLREVWGPQDSHEHHYLRVFVANLRKKIETDPGQPKIIITEQGVGYRIAMDT